MAYPFPRLNSSPQTPQHLKGIESPQRKMSDGPERPLATYKLLLLMLMIITPALIIIWIFPVQTFKQSDRIAFSSGIVDEWVFQQLSAITKLTSST